MEQSVNPASRNLHHPYLVQVPAPKNHYDFSVPNLLSQEIPNFVPVSNGDYVANVTDKSANNFLIADFTTRPIWKENQSTNGLGGLEFEAARQTCLQSFDVKEVTHWTLAYVIKLRTGTTGNTGIELIGDSIGSNGEVLNANSSYCKDYRQNSTQYSTRTFTTRLLKSSPAWSSYFLVVHRWHPTTGKTTWVDGIEAWADGRTSNVTRSMRLKIVLGCSRASGNLQLWDNVVIGEVRFWNEPLSFSQIDALNKEMKYKWNIS